MGFNQYKYPFHYEACGCQMEINRRVQKKMKANLLPQVVIILLCMTTANSSFVKDCRKECKEEWPAMEVLRCSAGDCLMRSRGYNWREAPKRNPMSSGTPVFVSLDFKVVKIYKIDLVKDQLDIVMWMEMSWVDPNIKVCPCGEHRESRIDVEHEDDLWHPDLHLLEAKEFKNIKGLTTDRENMQVILNKNKQPLVVQSLNFRAVLDCHINTLASLHTRNSCLVRFGSYIFDNTEVVFQQNSRFLKDEIVHSKYYVKLSPLHKKAKKVVRGLLKMNREQENFVFAYDGFELNIQGKLTSSEVQVHVSMLLLVTLAMLCLFALSGHPEQIDRSGLFSATLLGSILTLVQLTDETPDGLTPLMSFFRVSIVGIMFCLAYYCILVMLNFDGLITGIFQHRIEKGLLVVSLCTYMAWLSYHFVNI